MRTILLSLIAIASASGAAACAKSQAESSGAGPVSANTPSGAPSDPSTADGGGEPTCNADLQNDPDHCGRCGRSCLGGACEAGWCRPSLIAKTHDKTFVSAMLLTSDSVYWAENGTNQFAYVYRMPLAGDTPEDTGRPEGDEGNGFHAPAVHTFVESNGGLLLLNTDCCAGFNYPLYRFDLTKGGWNLMWPTTAVATGSVYLAGAANSKTVFTIIKPYSSDTPLHGSIYGTSLDGLPASAPLDAEPKYEEITPYTERIYSQLLATEKELFFLGLASDSDTEVVIGRLDLATRKTAPLATLGKFDLDATRAQKLVRTGDQLVAYVDGRIFSVGIDGTGKHEVGNFPSPYEYPTIEVAASGDAVFVAERTNVNENDTTGRLWSVPLAGGTPKVHVDGAPVMSLAADERYVFFSEYTVQGTPKRILRLVR